MREQKRAAEPGSEGKADKGCQNESGKNETGQSESGKNESGGTAEGERAKATGQDGRRGRPGRQSRPYFILKGRQQGFTTLITAIQLSYAITQRNFSGFTMADSADNTRAIFGDKARTVYNGLPALLRPTEKYNSANELFFDKLNSSWRCSTATAQVGRSRTLNFVHFSEMAFYDCDFGALQAAINPAITTGAIQIYETTANGFNHAKELWDSGSCINLFYEWWRTPEYRCREWEYLDKADGWLRERMALLYEMGLDREQVCWYAKTYDGYIDKSMIRQEYPITPDEAWRSSGACVFDADKISDQLTRAERQTRLQAPRRGYFTYERCAVPLVLDGRNVGAQMALTQCQWVDSADGYITIYQEPQAKDECGRLTDDPEKIRLRCPYVIGGDTAGDGIDYFTAKVLDNSTGRTVAALRKQRMDDDLYAEQILCLAKYYHDALVGIETNYSRQPMRVLQSYGYTRLYMREKMNAITDRPERIPGFETTAVTKPIIISDLVRLMREDPTRECDPDTLREMLTFVRNGSKTEASAGAHDDMVMATAIAHHIGGQQSRQWEVVSPPEDDFNTRNFPGCAGPEGNGGFLTW